MVEGLSAIALEKDIRREKAVLRETFHFAGGVVEAFRPEEKAVLGPVGPFVQGEVAVQP